MRATEGFVAQMAAERRNADVRRDVPNSDMDTRLVQQPEQVRAVRFIYRGKIKTPTCSRVATGSPQSVLASRSITSHRPALIASCT